MHWLLISFKINRDVSLQAFLFKDKVFSEVVQYDFEPYRHDNVSTIFKSKSNHTSFGCPHSHTCRYAIIHRQFLITGAFLLKVFLHQFFNYQQVYFVLAFFLT